MGAKSCPAYAGVAPRSGSARREATGEGTARLTEQCSAPRNTVRRESGYPPKTDPAREQRVRERAYHLWEADGKPHGRDMEYWERARELIAIEDSADPACCPTPRPITNRSARPAGEAEIQDNLGEFPDRFADQGEVRPTPTARRSPARRRRRRRPPKNPRRRREISSRLPAFAVLLPHSGDAARGKRATFIREISCASFKYGRVLLFLGRDIRIAGVLAGVNLVVAGLQFLDPVLFGRVVGLLARSDDIPAATLWHQGLILLGIWAAVGMGGIVSNIFVSVQTERLAHRHRIEAMGRYFRHVLALPLSFHGEAHSGRVIKTMLAGTDGLFGTWLVFFRDQLSTVLSAVVLLPLTLFLNWRLALVLIVLVCLFLCVTALVVRKTEAAQRRVEGQNRRWPARRRTRCRTSWSCSPSPGCRPRRGCSATSPTR